MNLNDPRVQLSFFIFALNPLENRFLHRLEPRSGVSIALCSRWERIVYIYWPQYTTIIVCFAQLDVNDSLFCASNFKQVDIYFDTASENISCELIALSSTSQRLHLRLQFGLSLNFIYMHLIQNQTLRELMLNSIAPPPTIFIQCGLLPSEDANNGEDVLRIQYMYRYK